MLRFISIVCIIIFMTACATSFGNNKLGTKESVEMQLTDHTHITKADVIALYGKPDLIFNSNGKEVFEYHSVTFRKRPLKYVFLVSFFIDPHSYNSKNVYVHFDKDGNMSDHRLIYESGTFDNSKF